MKKCAECGQDFEFKTHNQKYCSNQCCRIATNKRIMEKYYQKRERLSGKERRCDKCESILSKYNANEVCAKCESELVKYDTVKAIGDIRNVIVGIEKGKRKKNSGN
jgi:hypothetical protein